MKDFFTPDYMFPTFDAVTPEFLQSIGVRMLLIDIDNTLAPYEEPDPNERVLAWFAESRDNNIVYTFRNDEENKDVYMVALRDGDGALIGYYEKHEYRNIETAKLYDIEI
mgnify:CR=1 FL=1